MNSAGGTAPPSCATRNFAMRSARQGNSGRAVCRANHATVRSESPALEERGDRREVTVTVELACHRAEEVRGKRREQAARVREAAMATRGPR